jgi:hypothetical protein
MTPETADFLKKHVQKEIEAAILKLNDIRSILQDLDIPPLAGYVKDAKAQLTCALFTLEPASNSLPPNVAPENYKKILQKSGATTQTFGYNFVKIEPNTPDLKDCKINISNQGVDTPILCKICKQQKCFFYGETNAAAAPLDWNHRIINEN